MITRLTKTWIFVGVWCSLACWCFAEYIPDWSAPPNPDEFKTITMGSLSFKIAPHHQSPSPAELRLLAPVSDQVRRAFELERQLNNLLQGAKRLDKAIEDAETDAERQRARAQLEAYYKQNERGLAPYFNACAIRDRAVSQYLSQMSRERRMMDPMISGIIKVVPWMETRQNTYPRTAGNLNNLRNQYESTRVKSGPKADWPFAEWQRNLHEIEKSKGFKYGFLTALAWRETNGNVQQGAANAKELGLYQNQLSDYREAFPLEPPFHIRQYHQDAKWVPFATAMVTASVERRYAEAAALGMTGDEQSQMAYRFYNEGVGYTFFAQQRLRIYRDLFNIDREKMPTNIPHLIDRFVSFTEDDVLMQYDWPYEDTGRTMGEELWNRWKQIVIQVEDDTIWDYLRHEFENPRFRLYYTIEERADGTRICIADLCEAFVKRRGAISLPGSGAHTAAITLCMARGQPVTCDMMYEYLAKPVLAGPADTPQQAAPPVEMGLQQEQPQRMPPGQPQRRPPARGRR